ncbi:MAG TPA: MAPEG family protein [Burkholderiales bacterium]|nr:MAPEG family protein [Burkholderiales bacterium]
MKQELILLPLVAMALLTAIVWVRLYIVRVGEMRARRIPAQQIASRAGAALTQTGPADNFMNLFELPVLFYLVVALLYALRLGDALYLWLAVGFVVLRYVHSFIHITYNKVMHRFPVYVAGGIVLWVMWIRFSFQLIEHVSI